MSDNNIQDIDKDKIIYDYPTVARRGLFCNQCELKDEQCNCICNKVLEEDLRNGE
jgi:hypothetical protein